MLKLVSRFGMSIAKIKQLREASGSPINDCKKALESTGGNFEAAIAYLKERGLAQADKKAHNETKQGVIVTLCEQGTAVIAEINCETDFVARTEEFLTFSSELIKYAALHKIGSKEELLDQKSNSGYFQGSIDEKRRSLMGKIQENIVVSKLELFIPTPNSVLGIYSHNRYNNTPCAMAGSILELTTTNLIHDDHIGLALREAANNLAVSYLGYKPLFMNRDQVTQEVKDRLSAEVKAEHQNKTPKQQEYIIKGKLQKYCEENVFLDMEYLMNDEEKSITEYLKGLESIVKGQIEIGRHLHLSI